MQRLKNSDQTYEEAKFTIEMKIYSEQSLSEISRISLKILRQNFSRRELCLPANALLDMFVLVEIK